MVGHTSAMLHIKSQGHQYLVLEIFKEILPYMGMEDHLKKLWFLPPKESPYEIRVIGPVVSEKMVENVGRRTDGCRSNWYTISSTKSLRRRLAKKAYNLYLLKVLVYKLWTS